MKLRIAYAVRVARESATPWLADTCAGGTWVGLASDAVTFRSHGEALDALAAAEISNYLGNYAPLEIVPLVEEYA